MEVRAGNGRGATTLTGAGWEATACRNTFGRQDVGDYVCCHILP